MALSHCFAHFCTEVTKKGLVVAYCTIMICRAPGCKAFVHLMVATGECFPTASESGGNPPGNCWGTDLICFNMFAIIERYRKAFAIMGQCHVVIWSLMWFAMSVSFALILFTVSFILWLNLSWCLFRFCCVFCIFCAASAIWTTDLSLLAALKSMSHHVQGTQRALRAATSSAVLGATLSGWSQLVQIVRWSQQRVKIQEASDTTWFHWARLDEYNMGPISFCCVKLGFVDLKYVCTCLEWFLQSRSNKSRQELVASFLLGMVLAVKALKKTRDFQTSTETRDTEHEKPCCWNILDRAVESERPRFGIQNSS